MTDLRDQLADFEAAACLRPHPLMATLTVRQRQVVTLMSGGCSNPQIAAQLGVSPSTVTGHTKKVMRRLGARNRWQAIVRAWAAGEVW